MQSKLYTTKGDSGQTFLSGGRRVPKTNALIELNGQLEELISQLGVARTFLSKREEKMRDELAEIQDQLVRMLHTFRKNPAERTALTEAEVRELERWIDTYTVSMDQPDLYAFSRFCHSAALMDQARSMARRAERTYIRSDMAVGSKESALHRRYLNRLGDYLFAAARTLDEKRKNTPEPSPEKTASVSEQQPLSAGFTAAARENSIMNPMSLQNIKIFMQALENEAARRGLSLVIAVCDRGGHPVAVHVMDDAFLASYDIAVNKAYTAVSLKMSTKELAALCAPGGSLYGLQQTNQGRIVIFGGGVTLRDLEGNIVGGLGVSGSTAEIDTMMGDVGEALFLQLQKA